MGLPSAQLGSLPSMNVPSSVPVVGVQKSPKIWQQALLNILTQTAGAAATQGIGNVMSQDYSDDPATGWEKLTKGPRMDKSQKMQKTSLDAASGEALKGREFSAAESKLGRELTTSEANLTRAQQKELFDKQAAQQNMLSARQDMNALQRLITGGDQDLARVFAAGDVSAANDREKYNLGVMDPKNIAQTKLIEQEIVNSQQKTASQKFMQDQIEAEARRKAGGGQAGEQRPPVQRAVGDGSGPFPQASDALASLYMALTTSDNNTATATGAGTPSPYVAMRTARNASEALQGRTAPPVVQPTIPVVRPDVPVVQPDIPVIQPDPDPDIQALLRLLQQSGLR